MKYLASWSFGLQTFFQKKKKERKKTHVWEKSNQVMVKKPRGQSKYRIL